MLVNEKAALVLYNITVTESHGMELIHFDPPLYGEKPGIVAKATETGNYTARIVAIMGGGSPPFTMRITKGIVVTEWVSYSYLLYPSIGLFVASAVLVIYGFREKKTGHWRRPDRRVVTKEKETVREVVMIPCKHCGASMPQTDTSCPRCGARRTA
jgi:hypothetical protein